MTHLEIQTIEVEILKKMFEESNHLPTKQCLLKLYLIEDVKLNNMLDCD